MKKKMFDFLGVHIKLEGILSVCKKPSKGEYGERLYVLEIVYEHKNKVVNYYFTIGRILHNTDDSLCKHYYKAVMSKNQHDVFKGMKIAKERFDLIFEQLIKQLNK